MYEDPNVSDISVTAVFTFASDEASEPMMRGEVVDGIRALADDLGHDVQIALPPVFVSILDTQNFRFVALGETEQAAEQAAAAGFSRHLVQYCPGETTEAAQREQFAYSIDEMPDDDLALDVMDSEWWRTVVGEYYGFRTVELQAGQCSRDEDRLV